MTKKTFLLGFTALWCGLSMLSAQVTIGADNAPQAFSILELISGNDKGLRLPQLTTDQRNTLAGTFGAEATGKALGLTIFNITTKCVETWNGTTWIQQCPPSGPVLPPVAPSAPASCGITPTSGNNLTYTAKADPNAEAYEFFLSGVSQGEQASNTITFASAQASANVSVAYLYPPAFLKPKMVSIPGNSGANWYYGSGIGTTVAIPAFSMSETEVTQAQFEYVMGINPAYFSCGGSGASYVSSRPTSALPVEQINWYEAVIFCNRLSIMEGKTPCYSISGFYTAEQLAALDYGSSEIPTSTGHANYSNWNSNFVCNFSANGYRLPTESEWEYAARGGTGNNHPVFAGSDATSEDASKLCEVAWWTGNNDATTTCGVASNIYGTKPVKGKSPNTFGLYDMTGNVREWCWNWYDETFPMATPVADVASAGSSSTRAYRGGCWISAAFSSRVSNRFGSLYDHFYNFGFRVVLAP